MNSQARSQQCSSGFDYLSPFDIIDLTQLSDLGLKRTYQTLETITSIISKNLFVAYPPSRSRRRIDQSRELELHRHRRWKRNPFLTRSERLGLASFGLPGNGPCIDRDAGIWQKICWDRNDSSSQGEEGTVFHRIHLGYRTASAGSFWMFLTEIDMSDKGPAAHANSNSSTAPLLSLNATIVRY